MTYAEKIFFNKLNSELISCIMQYASNSFSQSSKYIPGEFLTLFNNEKEEQMLVGQSFEFEAPIMVFHQTKNSENSETGENGMELDKFTIIPESAG